MRTAPGSPDPEFVLKTTPPRIPRTVLERSRLSGTHPEFADKSVIALQAAGASALIDISPRFDSFEGHMTTLRRAIAAPMSVFERYLTVWVFTCIVVGIAAGQLFPGVFQAIGRMEVARVNLPVGLLIWVMIIPMLVKVDFGALHEVRKHVRGIGVTLFVNWLVKPFSMALLAWIFVRHLFAPWLPAEQVDGYVAGLILLAAAPCTAMVFVWSRLSNGDPMFTLTQVALNDAIMVVAFAPLVGLLLGIAAITVPWNTLITSVVLYIVIPVILAQLWRRSLLARGQAAFDAAMARIGPWSTAPCS